MGWFRLVWRARRVVLGLIGLLALLGLIATARAILEVRRFEAERLTAAATLFDVNGNVITTLGRRRRAYVPLAEIPRALREAIVAIEDSRFYVHPGIDPIGIGRAFVANLRAGRIVQGASTITQQLAKNLFLTPERTLTRKIDEALLAVVLEMRYPKDRILELYLNYVHFGEGVWGVDAAAHTYFGKPAPSLDLAESALLAGLVRGPALYSPYRDEEAALARRATVLERMVDLGYISPSEADHAREEPLRLSGERAGSAPYFADMVAAELVQRFGRRLVQSGSLRVHTTLDVTMQKAAVAAMGAHQGAIVALDPGSGAIRALVGGRDYVASQFNRATQALRQPGSAFKPFVYAAAIERGWQENSVVQDIPSRFGDYAPENFDRIYWGTVTLKQALVSSLNNGTVWLLDRIGVEAALEMATRLGIDTLDDRDRNLSIGLGGLTRGVSPLTLAAAYQAFANGGWRFTPYAIEQVLNSDGRVLYDHAHQLGNRGVRVLSSEVAFIITDMLRSVIQRGTGTAANIGRAAAGKTGTSDERENAWFAGYTPNLVSVVYIGNDDRRSLPGGGGTLAAPVWGQFMTQATAALPAVPFPVPPEILTGIGVDPFTGLLAGPACRAREEDAFLTGTAPGETSPCTWGAPQPVPFQITPQGARPVPAGQTHG